MPDEEPGLLGNLPRSRPGTRSEKRESTRGESPGGRQVEPEGPASKPAPKRSQAAKRAGAAKKAKRAGSVKSKAPAKATPGTTRATGEAAPTPTGRKGSPTSDHDRADKTKSVPVNVVGPSEARHEGDGSRSGPLRSAAKVAGSGLRVAEGVTREVLRRLPRP